MRTSKISLGKQSDAEALKSAREAIAGFPGVINVACKENLLYVIHKTDRETQLRELLFMLQDLGYQDVHLLPEQQNMDLRQLHSKELSAYVRKFLFAFAIHIPVIVLMWVVPFESPALMTSPVWSKHRPLYILALFFLTTINQFVSGANFYKGALKSIRNRSANMDSLVVLGTTAAWLHGLCLILIGYQLPENFSKLASDEQ